MEDDFGFRSAAVLPECGHFADGGVSDRPSESPEWRIVIVSPVQLS
jgi:hypothetical protein